MGDMDENWTDKDQQELHEAGLEGARLAKLYKENPAQWEAEWQQRERDRKAKYQQLQK